MRSLNGVISGQSFISEVSGSSPTNGNSPSKSPNSLPRGRRSDAGAINFVRTGLAPGAPNVERFFSEKLYEQLDCVGGHATNAEDGLAMYVHNGKVYKPWVGLSEKELKEGRVVSRGRIEYEFYKRVHKSDNPLKEFLCGFYGKDNRKKLAALVECSADDLSENADFLMKSVASQPRRASYTFGSSYDRKTLDSSSSMPCSMPPLSAPSSCITAVSSLAGGPSFTGASFTGGSLETLPENSISNPNVVSNPVNGIKLRKSATAGTLSSFNAGFSNDPLSQRRMTMLANLDGYDVKVKERLVQNMNQTLSGATKLKKNLTISDLFAERRNSVLQQKAIPLKQRRNRSLSQLKSNSGDTKVGNSSGNTPSDSSHLLSDINLEPSRVINETRVRKSLEEFKGRIELLQAQIAEQESHDHVKETTSNESPMSQDSLAAAMEKSGECPNSEKLRAAVENSERQKLGESPAKFNSDKIDKRKPDLPETAEKEKLNQEKVVEKIWECSATGSACLRAPNSSKSRPLSRWASSNDNSRESIHDVASPGQSSIQEGGKQSTTSSTGVNLVQTQNNSGSTPADGSTKVAWQQQPSVYRSSAGAYDTSSPRNNVIVNESPRNQAAFNSHTVPLMSAQKKVSLARTFPTVPITPRCSPIAEGPEALTRMPVFTNEFFVQEDTRQQSKTSSEHVATYEQPFTYVLNTGSSSSSLNVDANTRGSTSDASKKALQDNEEADASCVKTPSSDNNACADLLKSRPSSINRGASDMIFERSFSLVQHLITGETIDEGELTIDECAVLAHLSINYGLPLDGLITPSAPDENGVGGPSEGRSPSNNQRTGANKSNQRSPSDKSNTRSRSNGSKGKCSSLGKDEENESEDMIDEGGNNGDDNGAKRQFSHLSQLGVEPTLSQDEIEQVANALAEEFLLQRHMSAPAVLALSPDEILSAMRSKAEKTIVTGDDYFLQQQVSDGEISVDGERVPREEVAESYIVIANKEIHRRVNYIKSPCSSAGGEPTENPLEDAKTSSEEIMSRLMSVGTTSGAPQLMTRNNSSRHKHDGGEEHLLAPALVEGTAHLTTNLPFPNRLGQISTLTKENLKVLEKKKVDIGARSWPVTELYTDSQVSQPKLSTFTEGSPGAFHDADGAGFRMIAKNEVMQSIMGGGSNTFLKPSEPIQNAADSPDLLSIPAGVDGRAVGHPGERSNTELNAETVRSYHTCRSNRPAESLFENTPQRSPASRDKRSLLSDAKLDSLKQQDRFLPNAVGDGISPTSCKSSQDTVTLVRQDSSTSGSNEENRDPSPTLGRRRSRLKRPDKRPSVSTIKEEGGKSDAAPDTWTELQNAKVAGHYFKRSNSLPIVTEIINSTIASNQVDEETGKTNGCQHAHQNRRLRDAIHPSESSGNIVEPIPIDISGVLPKTASHVSAASFVTQNHMEREYVGRKRQNLDISKQSVASKVSSSHFTENANSGENLHENGGPGQGFYKKEKKREKKNPNTYIILHDVTHGMDYPCVMDLKIGTQTYDELAGKKKQQSAISKYPQQAEIGLRIIGMKYYRIARKYKVKEGMDQHESASKEGTTIGARASTGAENAKSILRELWNKKQEMEGLAEQEGIADSLEGSDSLDDLEINTNSSDEQLAQGTVLGTLHQDEELAQAAAMKVALEDRWDVSKERPLQSSATLPPDRMGVAVERSSMNDDPSIYQLSSVNNFPNRDVSDLAEKISDLPDYQPEGMVTGLQGGSRHPTESVPLSDAASLAGLPQQTSPFADHANHMTHSSRPRIIRARTSANARTAFRRGTKDNPQPKTADTWESRYSRFLECTSASMEKETRERPYCLGLTKETILHGIENFFQHVEGGVRFRESNDGTESFESDDDIVMSPKTSKEYLFLSASKQQSSVEVGKSDIDKPDILVTSADDNNIARFSSQSSPLENIQLSKRLSAEGVHHQTRYVLLKDGDKKITIKQIPSVRYSSKKSPCHASQHEKDSSAAGSILLSASGPAHDGNKATSEGGIAQLNNSTFSLNDTVGDVADPTTGDVENCDSPVGSGNVLGSTSGTDIGGMLRSRNTIGKTNGTAPSALGPTRSEEPMKTEKLAKTDETAKPDDQPSTMKANQQYVIGLVPFPTLKHRRQQVQLRMLHRFNEQLRKILNIFENHPWYRIYSSSILVVYDYFRPLDTLKLYLIDFAHVFEIKPEDKGTKLEKDYKYIYGLKQLIRYVRMMIDRARDGVLGNKNEYYDIDLEGLAQS